MHLLAREEAGLRCLLQVASHPGPEPLTGPEIARREGLGPEYVARIMRALRAGGLVISTRGAAGGYRLARPAGRISVHVPAISPCRRAGFYPGQSIPPCP